MALGMHGRGSAAGPSDAAIYNAVADSGTPMRRGAGGCRAVAEPVVGLSVAPEPRVVKPRRSCQEVLWTD